MQARLVVCVSANTIPIKRTCKSFIIFIMQQEANFDTPDEWAEQTPNRRDMALMDDAPMWMHKIQ